MSAGVSPFLVPDPAAVSLDNWRIDLGAGPVDLPTFIPDWDSSTDLHLTRTVRVDVDRVVTEADLPPAASLMWVVEWFASTARISGSAYRGYVAGSDPASVSIKLEGDRLSGVLGLTTRLVIADDMACEETFTACHAGDVLFEEVARTQLEGGAGRMPTYVVDFAEMGFDPDARWHIELPRSLDEPVLSGIRLYLNEADTEIVAAATKAAAPSPAQRRLLDWLETDMTGRLVDAALRTDWVDQLGDYVDDGDTVGGSLGALIANIFPSESAVSVAALKETDPGRFHSRVQGAVRRMRREHDDSLPQTV